MPLPLDYREIVKQEQRVQQFATVAGNTMAIYYGCIAFDVPYFAKAVPVVAARPWTVYIDNLRKDGKGQEKAMLGFLDGETDIEAVFANTEAARTAAKHEQGTRGKGPAGPRKIWGTGSEDCPYTNEDYDRLEEIYERFASRLKSTGGPDPQQEHILRLCTKMSLDQEKYLEKGQIEKAQKLNKMIQDNLSSENLRKKDEKPVDDIKIDAIIDRMEKAGIMENGEFCQPDVMFERIFGHAPKYAYTKDAAEQMLLAIINTTRMNDGYAELGILPDNARITDNIGEFAEEPNAVEKESYDKLGLVPMPKGVKQ